MAALSERARAFLQEKPRFGVLGTVNADGSPHLTTMWFLLDGDEILMNTKVGRVKERNMRRDPRVSLCVEDGYRYVTISGRVRFIEDPTTAQVDIYRLACYYDGEEQARLQMEHFSREQRVTVRLSCEQVLERL
ncbi:PPOX class F420-dependent oxidoreductase [Thermogemmatispora onikobensis]|uniref:PPOX class F420-dependent oxidoreductase n=1 Tax=Thermogemmatispora onikobensis TaxID=732234 RepID=UPI000852FDDF|nr:PPOX class F420-dependent oxidoreductase [Thermogemmatispora onikobensis]